jgi:FtsP/CotA-like multicopper oxidase with cupredoxin domain
LSNFTRRQLLVAAAPAVAATPLLKLAVDQQSAPAATHHLAGAHADMTGAMTPAPGGPHDLDALLYPPAALPHQPGRVREYEIAAVDREIEVAAGVFFAAWTYNGTVPGPVLRATEDDVLRVKFANGGSHPHTIHFHGIHPANMDGVFEVVEPGGSYTYEFPARPYGMHLYHCHSTPLKKHIAKGLYGALIIDPPAARRPALELVMVLSGFDTDGDGANNFYGVNGPAFYYAKYPIRVRRSQTVRIYLANLTEFDLINSFHLHGDFFRYYPTGSGESFEYTDTVMLCQGQRGIVEIDFSNTGRFMFHAHQSEFTELGWMGFFEVTD